MSKKLLFFSFLILILSSCHGVTNVDLRTQTKTPVVLPDTWTPEPTNFTSPTPSPTPTQPPPFSPSPSSGGHSGLTPTAEPPAAVPPLTSGEEVTIISIRMFTPNQGWAVGTQGPTIPRILITNDGAQSWQDRTPPIEFSSNPFLMSQTPAVYFWDQNTAWVLYEQEIIADEPDQHHIWHTSDGGVNWSASDPLPYQIELYSGTPAQFFFIGPQQGWFLSHSIMTHMHDYSSLFRTLDGGQTWHLVNQPGDSMIEALANTEIAFSNEKAGWMLKDSLGGFEPFLEVTLNGGIRWQQVDLPAPDGSWFNLDRRCIGSDPVFFPDGEGRFLLNCAAFDEDLGTYDLETAASYIYSSDNMGSVWQIKQLPSSVNQLVFHDGQIGHALGSDHYITRDGGASWNLVKSVSWTGDFSFISPLEIWAVARDGDEIALVHSVDGGDTYQLIQPIILD